RRPRRGPRPSPVRGRGWRRSRAPPSRQGRIGRGSSGFLSLKRVPVRHPFWPGPAQQRLGVEVVAPQVALVDALAAVLVVDAVQQQAVAGAGAVGGVVGGQRLEDLLGRLPVVCPAGG